MSFHEVLLDQRFWGINVFSILGLFITLGVALSCVCRINAIRPNPWWRFSTEAIMYMVFAGWAMESFIDLVFIQMYSGYDIALGGGIMLHLYSTYAEWEGDDCVCDFLNFWRLRKRMQQRARSKQHS